MTRTNTPWGWFETVYSPLDCKVKRLCIFPNLRISLQRHKRRNEVWCVLSGEGVAAIGAIDMLLTENAVCRIPHDVVHRVKNTGDKNLVIIEVQTGHSFEESDIDRIEDDYGRVS